MDLYNKNKSNVTYFMLDNDFNIKNENQIIYAPNGTGKTSIYRDILNLSNGEILNYDYNDSEFVKNDNVFIINTRTEKLINLKNDYESKKDIVLPQNLLKGKFVNPTAKGLENSGIGDIYKIFTKKKYDVKPFKPLRKTQRELLQPFLNNEKDLFRLLEDENRIRDLYNNSKNYQISLLKNADVHLLFHAGYSIEKHENDIKSEGCPFCGRNSLAGEDVYSLILNKRNEILSLKESIFNGYECLAELKDVDKIENAIDNAVQGLISLSEEQKQTLLFTIGDEEKEKERKKSIADFNKAKQKYDAMLIKQNDLYDLMKGSMDYIQKNIEKYYEKVSVQCDDSDKSIQVSLPRKVSTYSDGEQHRLYEVIKLLGFIGSDKDTLVVDDPLTQLDCANQYQIVFDFIDAINANLKKHVIIFTCNAEMINVSYSQAGKKFKYYYLSSYRNENNTTLKIMRINYTPESTESYLNIRELYAKKNQSVEDKIISYLCKRNEYEIRKLNRASKSVLEKCEQLDKIFHYDKPEEYKKLSNDALVLYIENINYNQSSSDFNALIKHKISILAALRVWIEKKIYDLAEYNESIHGDPNLDKIKFEGKTMSQKIKYLNDCMQNTSCESIKTYYPNWNKKLLMSQKTMINDVCHPFSQFAPFDYAMSISEHDLYNDVKVIKSVFND